LFVVSVVASLLSLVIPRVYLRLLGIAAILIDAKKLLDLYRGLDKPEETLEHHSNAGANGRTATVAFVTIANSLRHPPGNLSCSRAKAKRSTSAEAPALPMHSIYQCGRKYRDSGYRSSLFRWV